MTDVTEPVDFKVNKDVTINQLLKNGFIHYDRFYVLKKCLYYYDETKNPYITLKIDITFDEESGDPMLIYNVVCDDGYCYPAFYDPDLRHNNYVYETSVRLFNQIIDRLVTSGVLIYEEQ